jgi:hypothetical protein
MRPIFSRYVSFFPLFLVFYESWKYSFINFNSGKNFKNCLRVYPFIT